MNLLYVLLVLLVVTRRRVRGNRDDAGAAGLPAALASGRTDLMRRWADV
jgi:hypothetical protein